MLHSTHTCRPLTAATLAVGLCLTGAAAALADTVTPTSSTPVVQTRAANQQWTIAPNKGAATGGTKVTLTPPEINKGRFTQASAGEDGHSMAIDLDGNLYTWGWNNDGQLGRDTGDDDEDGTPGMVTKPAGIDKWTQISTGNYYSLAIGSDGNLYTWGSNNSGELGRDTDDDSNRTPGMVTKPANVDKWIQASAGYKHSMALGSDGNLYTWGRNDSGELGRNTTTTPEDRPGMVTKPANVDKWIQISAGGEHSMALGSDGNLYTWGNNSGELGRNTITTPEDRPGMVTKPAGIDKWIQISAGGEHSTALGSDGNLYTWGNNIKGELGRDTDDDSNGTPGMVTKPAGIDKWIQASAGGSSNSMAIGSDGNLYTWGDNAEHQLGRDIGNNRKDGTPGMVTKPAGIDKWTQISTGDCYGMAIGSNGNLYSWGGNSAGQLGHPTDAGDDYNIGQVSPHEVVLTGVEFDGQAGTGLTSQADGTWTVTTPAHAAGEVTVTLSWTLNGTPQPQANLTYTYAAVRTVTFDPADGSPLTTQQVTDGDKAIKPTNPTRDGYQFDGWFKETDAYDFNQPVTKDLTLTAHWTSTANQKPTNPSKKPDKPASDPEPSDSVLSKTGSDTATILTAGLLALAAGILTLTGVRTRQRATQSPTTR